MAATRKTKGKSAKGEPHVTKLEIEDVQYPGKHSSVRSRRSQKRKHEHNRHQERKHTNW